MTDCVLNKKGLEIYVKLMQSQKSNVKLSFTGILFIDIKYIE